jgi:hypothetical protein
MALISIGIPSLSTKLALDETNRIVLIGAQGLGMPPVQNQMTDYALLDGASYQKTRTQTRTITLQLAAMGTSWDGTGGLHLIRHALVDAVNPHRATGLPIKLYYEGNRAAGRHLNCYYDAGLELGEVQGYTETMAIRLLAPDPYFYANTGATATAGMRASATSPHIAMERAGVWSTTGFGMAPLGAGYSYAIRAKPGGGAYVGGAFNTAGSVSVAKITLWTGTAWQTLGGGIKGTGKTVNALAVAPNGDVYAGGSFNTAGSTSCKNVARWDVSMRAWCKLSTGTVGIVRALDINRDGNLVVAGSFQTAGGVAMKRIALWNGTKWTTLGAGLSGIAYAVGISPTNQVVVGGAFHTAGTVRSRHIAYWSGSAWSVPGGSAAAWETSDEVRAIELDGSNLYAGGLFHTAGLVAASHVAVWNGYSWSPMGAGANDAVRTLRTLSNDRVFAGGDFTDANSQANGFAFWNGYTWIPVAGDLRYGYAVDEDAASGALYYGGLFASEIFSKRTTITNGGTARAWPVLTLTGTTANIRLILVRNETNGKSLYFDYALLDGEVLTIDCRPGGKSVESSFFGTDISSAPLVASDLASFCLEPGDNSLSVYASYTGASTPSIALAWNNAYWGGD